jgi:uncharacterized Fe-S center protein
MVLIMNPDVRFFELGKFGDPLEGIDGLMKSSFGGRNLMGRRVAIKIHFGERGNYTHIRPSFVRRVVDFVKLEGGMPFIAETTTLYPTGYRLTVEDSLETARYNGFTEEGLGCPIVIADEPDGDNGVEFFVDNAAEDCRVKSVNVARHLIEADSMIVISHVKGHLLSGMGGAIKNLGMGCTTRHSKREQHAAHGLVWDYGKCSGCGKCIESCKFNALEMQGDKPVKEEGRCTYCQNCRFECENDAIRLYDNGKELFQKALAHASAGVMKAFSGKDVVFLNSILDVTPLCDCAAPAGRLVTQNVGLLISGDPVAIDRASLDLVDQASLMPGWDVKPPDVLGKINGTDSLIQMKEAVRLGVGSMSYNLVKI